MLAVGDTAPEFQLNDVRGRAFALKDILKQGPALLALFKVSCPVCQLTLPYLERLAKSTSVQIIGISQDDQRATEEFRKEFGISFPTLIDPASRGYAVSNDYGITSVPSLFLVQEDGEISAAWAGWSKRDMSALGQLAQVTLFEPGEKVSDWKSG